MDRKERLMPGGVPRWIRCYDNGGESFDRYSVVFTGRYPGERMVLAMSVHPFHPQGFGQHVTYPYVPDAQVGGKAYWPPAVGRWHANRKGWGKRIRFEDLPPDCQRAVLEDYVSLWRLK